MSGKALTPALNDREADWSPDGRRIVFVRGVRGVEELYVMRADGTGQRALTAEIGPDFTQPAWSPDGSRIVFGRQAGSMPEPELWVMRPDGREKRKLGAGMNPSWSPDGRRIAYFRRIEIEKGLWVMNSDGRDAHVVVDLGRRYGNNLQDVSPDWSPDGRRIAFSMYAPQQERALFLVNPDGSNTREILSGAQAPSWSPDGSRIVFHGPDPFIQVANADGSGRRRLTDGIDPSWSPKGGRIAYTRDVDPVLKVFTVAVTGGSPRDLTMVQRGCTILGTKDGDTLTGTDGPDIICGLGGNDRLAGRGGPDLIEGGPGADRVDGGGYRDRLRGGPGSDVLLARDGVEDALDGGFGSDAAFVDRKDELTSRDCRRIERVYVEGRRRATRC